MQIQLKFTAVARALLVGVLSAQALLAAAQPAAQPAAQAYPSKPIKVLVGVPPGGSTDALTRMFADWLQESMGQPTVVENRPGANTSIAADAVARSAPDGHTLLVATEALLTMSLLAKTTFDPFKDFVPVGTLAVNYFVFAVHPSVPVQSIQELVAHAKANPGKLNYGSSGNAGASHLGGEKFKMLTGTSILHIPYRGAGPALTDAVSGQYQLSLWTPLAMQSHIKANRLRPLAVSAPKRVSSLPQVPTFAEAGLPGYAHHSWLSVYAPAGTPQAIVDRLNAEIPKMMASPKYKAKLAEAGVEPLVGSPQQLTELMRKESVEIGNLIKAANIRMD
jgi:tripartite-type tricarboxylate transporter receptor subunit TctC